MDRGGAVERPSLTLLSTASRALRVLMLVGVAAGVAFMALGLVAGLWMSVVVGALQVLTFGLQAWMHWRRPARTRITGDGVGVQAFSRQERSWSWAEIERVLPATAGRPQSLLSLRDGTSLPLPGVTVETARWLAGLVHDNHAAAGEPSGG